MTNIAETNIAEMSRAAKGMTAMEMNAEALSGCKVAESVLQYIRQCSERDRDLRDLSVNTVVCELQMDSLKMVQLVFELENHYRIELQEHLLFQIDKVSDLVFLVHEARSRANEAGGRLNEPGDSQLGVKVRSSAPRSKQCRSNSDHG